MMINTTPLNKRNSRWLLMMAFLCLNEKETLDIMSVLHQDIKSRPPMTTAHKIMVLFPDIANELYKTNTPANGFCIRVRPSSDCTAHCREIVEVLWDRGYTTIEIIRSRTSCAFFVLPKAEVMARDITEVLIKAMGEDPHNEPRVQVAEREPIDQIEDPLKWFI